MKEFVENIATMIKDFIKFIKDLVKTIREYNDNKED